MDELATLSGPVERFRRLVRETSLAADADAPVYRLVRFAVAATGIESTTPTGGDGPTFAAEYGPGFFASFDGPDEPVVAALGTGATLRWLDWFDGGHLTVRFLGDADAGVARAVELEDGAHCVEVGPLPGDAVDPDLDPGRPAAFTGGQFAPGGDPAPTRIETDGETLERLADATDIVDDGGFPVVVRDGEFRLAVSGAEMRGRGTLPATVTGPDCENRYGPDLAAIARVLSGPVGLQVVPGGPLAVTARGDHASRRYVCRQVL